MIEEKKQLNYGESTIYEIVKQIEEDRFVMPAFQRQYVWNMEQIEKLWDSILSNFPISTFLFWHLDNNNTTNETFFCTFMKKMLFKNSKKQPADESYNIQTIDTSIVDTAILDGQQRLTSLYLSLIGETNLSKGRGIPYPSKLYIELDERKVETEEDGVNCKTFGIEFTDKLSMISPTKFEIRKILKEKFQDKETRQTAIQKEIQSVPEPRRKYAERVLNLLCTKIFDDKIIRYTEIFNMQHDDALEMFVRFNNGGIPLKKSEITMAILNVYWSNARTEFGHLLDGCYKNFGIDFIIRTALMLYGDVLKSCIDRIVASELRDNWSKFCKNLQNLTDVLKHFNLSVLDFSDRWNVLLPIIYEIDKNPDYMDNLDGIRCYLYRALFFTYFQNGTTTKLAKLRDAINEYNFSIEEDLLDQINELKLNDQKLEDILNTEKGKLTKTVLSILYVSRNIEIGNSEQDHIHPRVCFDKNKPIGVSDEEWRDWHKKRDKLPNLQYISKLSNAYKNDIPLYNYYNSIPSEIERKAFLDTGLIPQNISLEVKDFGKFYEERKNLLKEKIRELLSF
jgi:hypothetical protein